MTINFAVKSFEQLRNESLEISLMEYNSIKTAIPKTWMNQLKHHTGTFELLTDGSVNVNDTLKHISIIKCKECYKQFTQRNITTPAAISKWEEKYYYVNFDWSHIFKLPYLSCKETSLQSLQYQILNRYYPCKEILNIWYKDQDDKCDYCKEDIDSIEHYFFHCKQVKQIWVDLMFLFRDSYGVHFNLKCLDVIFGVMNTSNDDILTALNVCTLCCKMFIRTKKLNGDNVIFIEFQNMLKERICIERYICRKEGNYTDFVKKWGPLEEVLA